MQDSYGTQAQKSTNKVCEQPDSTNVVPDAGSPRGCAVHNHILSMGHLLPGNYFSSLYAVNLGLTAGLHRLR